jgi:hypothetical protein
VTRLRQVRKNDGRLVPFERSKLADAIHRAALAVGGGDRFLAEEVAGVVLVRLERSAGAVCSAADIRREVEAVLRETCQERTARAYADYRRSRDASLHARGVLPVPLVGGDGVPTPRAWSKERLRRRLLARERIEPAEAADVARRVEERVLRSGLPRVSRGLVAALVRSELFDRGRESSFGLPARVGVSPARVRRWLEGRPTPARLKDPASFAEAVGEDVVAEHVLAEVVPSHVAEAHRRGELDLHDPGAPTRLTAVALPGAALLAEEMAKAEPWPVGGARRAFGAVAAILHRYRPFAARVLAFEDLDVLLAPHVSGLSEEALAVEVRELLLSPAVQAFPARAGALSLELGLSLAVPPRLAGAEVPGTVHPVRTYADHADAQLRVARALLREAGHLLRAGGLPGVRVTLVVPRSEPRDAAARALVKQALQLASWSGEPSFVLESPRSPSRGTRRLRVREGEVPDPLRFDRGDLSVATTTGLDLVSLARSLEGGSHAAFAAEAVRRCRVVVDGMAARRQALEGPRTEPAGMLYEVSRGPVPRVDVETAFHVVELLGLSRAASLRLPGAGEEERAGWGHETASLVAASLAALGRDRGLLTAVTLPADPDAERRCRRLERLRWPAAQEGTPAPAARREVAPGLMVEPVRPSPAPDLRWSYRLRHVLDASHPPPVDALLGLLEEAEEDPAAFELRLDPWPRRVVRGP